MARAPAITYEEVAQAAEELLTSGKKPTINGVREKLGERGSPVTISKYLKDWKAAAISSNAGAFAGKDLPDNADSANFASPDERKASAASDREPKVKKVADETQPSYQKASSFKESQNHKGREEKSTKVSEEESKRPQRNKEHRNGYPFGRHRRERSPENRKRNEDIIEQITSTYADYYYIPNIDELDNKALQVQIRCLETCLNKEQSRRETAEKMALQAKEYAESIKMQVAQRINDVRQVAGEQIERLKAEVSAARERAEKDLLYYRDQLNKANQKILDLSGREEDSD